jgi:nicotinate phosphoribosyltransferase
LSGEAAWIRDGNAALLTDLYELTMMQAYFAEGLHDTAVFDLFARRLPDNRPYLVACGLETALHYLEALRFEDEALSYLEDLGHFSRGFLDYLADFRFTGTVRAVPEGTAVFADEPILEVAAPLPQAQLAETFLLNQIHFQTLAATKAARVVDAAQGRPVVDFGARRMHGTDAALKAARAYHVAGVAATSNVLAGQMYGVPVSGTMAHSFVEAHDNEGSAFEAFASQFPRTVLLVDTYDTLAGVRQVVAMAQRWGEAFQVEGIRLDSGDLADLARQARAILDEAGLEGMKILASGSLDEYTIGELLDQGAPIDGFGVGTHMGVSEDAPFVDSAYKLVAYAGRPRMKLATRKTTLPGAKQVFRQTDGEGYYCGDTLAGSEEAHPGTPLLETVMHDGIRTRAAPELGELRERWAAELRRLPPSLRSVTAFPGYPVTISADLEARRDRTRDALEAGGGLPG